MRCLFLLALELISSAHAAACPPDYVQVASIRGYVYKATQPPKDLIVCDNFVAPVESAPLLYLDRATGAPFLQIRRRLAPQYRGDAGFYFNRTKAEVMAAAEDVLGIALLDLAKSGQLTLATVVKAFPPMIRVGGAYTWTATAESMVDI